MKLFGSGGVPGETQSRIRGRVEAERVGGGAVGEPPGAGEGGSAVGGGREVVVLVGRRPLYSIERRERVGCSAVRVEARQRETEVGERASD